MLNPYFNNYNRPRTHRLIDNMVTEAIKKFGLGVKYLPVKNRAFDRLMFEDPIHYFEIAADLEAYVLDFDGFKGDRDILMKFGMEIRDQVSIVISKRRFRQIKTEKLGLENGWNFSLESANLLNSDSSHGVVLEDGTREGYDIDRIRPYEGDLIYIPMTGGIYEIKKVYFENNFYSFGSLYTFELKLELLEYSSEVFNTSNEIINNITEALSFDSQFFNLLAEDGSELQYENGFAFVLEEFAIEDRQSHGDADNRQIQIEAEEFMDFSEKIPFAKRFNF